MFANFVSGVAVVAAIVYAAMSSESIRRFVTPASFDMNKYKAVAVTVARGIKHNDETMAPSAPAVAISTVLVGVSLVMTLASVSTAVPVLLVCAKAAVFVIGIVFPFC